MSFDPASLFNARQTMKAKERAAVRAQLDAIIGELAIEELRVIALLARRLLAGQSTYGHLHLATDERDLEVERGDELADAAIYHGMLELRRLLKAREGKG